MNKISSTFKGGHNIPIYEWSEDLENSGYAIVFSHKELCLLHFCLTYFGRKLPPRFVLEKAGKRVSYYKREALKEALSAFIKDYKRLCAKNPRKAHKALLFANTLIFEIQESNARERLKEHL